MSELQSHPVAAILPLLEGDEYEAFRADIKERGLLEAIWLDDQDRIVDGRNRARACSDLGIEIKTQRWNGEGGSIVAFVASKNLQRRHLSASQRGIYIAEIATFERGRPSENRSDDPFSVSQPQAAAMVGVSVPTVKRATAVLKSGNQQLINDVKQGNKSVQAAAKEARAKKSPKQKDSDMAATNGAAQPAANGAIHGARLVIADGKTPEQAAREAMVLEDSGMKAADAAKALGLHDQTYRRMRDIILLSDKTDLSPRDSDLAKRALANLNDNRQIEPAYKMILPLVERVWGDASYRKGSGTRARKEAKRTANFEHAYGAMIQVCTGSRKVEIPHLAPDRAAEIAKELRHAIKSLQSFCRRIEEMHA